MRKYSEEKRSGRVYTPTDIGEYMAAQMISYRSRRPGSHVKILDPSAGTGELLICLLSALKQRGCEMAKVVGYETEVEAAQEATDRLKISFPWAEVDIRTDDWLMAERGEDELFDYIIANPPYVRTQVMGAEYAQFLSARYKLTGRVDLYYAFLASIGSALKEDGIASVIISNKFMTNASGAAVRKQLEERCALRRVIDLGDTKPFEAAVLPAIIFFERGRTIERSHVRFTSVYERKVEGEPGGICSPTQTLDLAGDFLLETGSTVEVRQGYLCEGHPGDLWRLSTKESSDWIERVRKNTYSTFADIGKIRVGIKTTADKVFIRDTWQDDFELIQPLITHHIGGQIVANQAPVKHVLYPYDMTASERKVVDLARFAVDREYLVKHYEQLAARQYLAKAGRQWFEIWVPQIPSKWSKGKIVFRDIAEHPQFWWDETGSVVNGDCYWIEVFSDIPTAAVYMALAVANSPFIEHYYDLRFGNKLYGGKRRFQSQYVTQFPIPNWGTRDGKHVVSLVHDIIANGFDAEKKSEIDRLVEHLFTS